MLFAMGMMSIFGVSGNLMSLGAIDFGLIVDGAVIIVEAIIHHIVHRRAAAPATLNAWTRWTTKALPRVPQSGRRPLFGEIIILIVYLPILALAGIEGKMFRPMAQTVSFAILGALILCLTYVPMMSALALMQDRTLQEEGTSPTSIMALLHRGYDARCSVGAGGARRWCWARRWRLLVLAGFLLFRTLGGEFIPQLGRGRHCR
ncbi:MAG: efflux RND transporter permease subunit [Hymenobacter sp.]